MQCGSDRTGSERTSGADDQSFDPEQSEDEDAELTRAQHDLAVANNAGQDPDPQVHDRPRTIREQ